MGDNEGRLIMYPEPHEYEAGGESEPGHTEPDYLPGDDKWIWLGSLIILAFGALVTTGFLWLLNGGHF